MAADLANAHSQGVMRSQRKHRERFRAYQREYWARPENQEKLRLKRARDTAWRKAKDRDNRLSVPELRAKAKVDNHYRQKKWRADHPERAAELSRRSAMHYAARKRGAQGNATADQVAARWAYYGQRCWMCGDPATQTDHVIPLNRGGPDWPANLRPCCATCNRAKWDQDHRLFIA
jgi:5-methylcytosine-specific restriction endonuclease McrA